MLPAVRDPARAHASDSASIATPLPEACRLRAPRPAQAIAGAPAGRTPNDGQISHHVALTAGQPNSYEIHIPRELAEARSFTTLLTRATVPPARIERIPQMRSRSGLEVFGMTTARRWQLGVRGPWALLFEGLEQVAGGAWPPGREGRMKGLAALGVLILV